MAKHNKGFEAAALAPHPDMYTHIRAASLPPTKDFAIVMAELVGLAAAIPQLLIYSNRARSHLSDLVHKVNDTPHFLDDLSNQVELMISLMKLINKPPVGAISMDPAIRRCTQKLTELKGLLDKVRSSTNNGKATRLGKVQMAFAWKSNEKNIERLWKDIDRELAILNFHFHVSHSVVEALGSCQKTTTIQATSVQPDEIFQRKGATLPPRNLQFIGRIEDLKDIEQKLEHTDAHNRVALVGLGGIGKSQAVIEYAYRLRQESPHTWIFFARASNELEFESSYQEFESHAKIASIDASNVQNSCRNVKAFLESEQSGRWLMIVDEADRAETFFGPKLLFKQLPQKPLCSIIFISRNKELAIDLVNPSDILHLNRLSEKDAVALLVSRSGESKAKTEHVTELAGLLEHLPLALVQAASFISKKSYSIQKYLCLYRETESAKIELLSASASRYETSPSNATATTWLISFDEIAQDNRFAAHLLSFMACIHCHGIPYHLLPTTGRSSVEISSALGLLEAYSMIQTEPLNETFDVHSLVQLTSRSRLRSLQQFGEYVQLAFDTVYQVFPPMFKSSRQLVDGNKYILHAQAVLDKRDSCDEGFVRLASRVSAYLFVIGNYGSALNYAERATDMSKAVFGESSSHTLVTQADIALLYQSLGRYEVAEDLTQQILDRRKQVLGEMHPDTLASLNNLGFILQDRGKYRAAEVTHRRTLELKEQVLGPGHDDTIKSLNNLGLALQSQEKYEAAENVFHKALIARQEAFDTNHTATLLSLSNLGSIFQLQGRLEDAWTMHSEAFDGRKNLLGEKHRDTLKSKANMATTRLGQKLYQESESMSREVLEDCVKLLGDDHPDCLTVRRNLATALHHQAKYQEAERLYREVFDARKIKLGEDHPSTISAGKLANDLSAQLTRKESNENELD